MRLRIAIVSIVLAAAAIAVARAERQEETPLRASFTGFPMQIGEWRGAVRPPLTEKVLAVLGLDDYMVRLYRRGEKDYADLYVGYWKSQRQGDTMHSPQNCLPGAGWEPVSQSLLTMPDPRNPNGPPLSLNRILIQKGIERQLVLYWYQGRGRVIGSEYMSKLYLMWDAAWKNRTDAAIVRIVVPVNGTSKAAEEDGEKAALAFVAGLLPALNSFLPD